ncbi:MAG: hypothetical protein JNK63_04755 [Chthonomonas sp.]|nr:hypothetical protein [Chthonomonas sp.]
MILNTYAQAGVDTGKDIVLKLFLFFTVAVIFFVLGYLSQLRKGNKRKWLKHVFGWLPVIAGIWMMLDYFRFATDSFNTEALTMNSSQIGLYKAAPFIALVFGLLLSAIGFFLDRRSENQVSDIL